MEKPVGVTRAGACTCPPQTLLGIPAVALDFSLASALSGQKVHLCRPEESGPSGRTVHIIDCLRKNKRQILCLSRNACSTLSLHGAPRSTCSGARFLGLRAVPSLEGCGNYLPVFRFEACSLRQADTRFSRNFWITSLRLYSPLASAISWSASQRVCGR